MKDFLEYWYCQAFDWGCAEDYFCFGLYFGFGCSGDWGAHHLADRFACFDYDFDFAPPACFDLGFGRGMHFGFVPLVCFAFVQMAD
jgi:hypothetical protein